MTWTAQDRTKLERLVGKYASATAAATALGISRFTMSRYRAGKSVPGSLFTENALREKIAALLGSFSKPKKQSSGKAA